MGKITNGKKIPDFKADATNDSTFDLKSNKKNLVIYFYPKDNTQDAQQKEKILEIYIKSLKMLTLKFLVFPEKV